MSFSFHGGAGGKPVYSARAAVSSEPTLRVAATVLPPSPLLPREALTALLRAQPGCIACRDMGGAPAMGVVATFATTEAAAAARAMLSAHRAGAPGQPGHCAVFALFVPAAAVEWADGRPAQV
jgi:hypothetical protein